MLSAVCVTVLYLVQLHHDSQVLGELDIVELREGFGSLCWASRLVLAGSDRVLSVSEWFIWGERARGKTWEVLTVGTKSQGAMYVLSTTPQYVSERICDVQLY